MSDNIIDFNKRRRERAENQPVSEVSLQALLKGLTSAPQNDLMADVANSVHEKMTRLLIMTDIASKASNMLSAFGFDPNNFYLDEESLNRYLTGETRRKVFHGFYKLPRVKMDNQKILLKDGQVLQIGGISIECILVPGHTWGHMVYLIDNQYLFTGDTIWFGADGGYSFISTLAEDNKLAVQSLEKLERNIRARKHPISVITGHTGWTDDLDFAFRHRAEICKPFTKKYSDPEAPYDGYVEDDDTEEKARTQRLKKKGSLKTIL